MALLLGFIPALLLLASAVLIETQTAYQESLAVQMLQLSAGAYGTQRQSCLNVAFGPQLQYYVYTQTTVSCDVLGQACESYIAISNLTRTAVLVFRGTKTDSQLLLEAWASYTSGKQFLNMGEVNSYFYDAHNKLWPAIADFLSRPEYMTYSLLVTGHSLGAALASLCAARIVSQGYRPSSAVRLYTYGQPRTGSYSYAMNFDALGIQSFRVVYSQDIIPHEPACMKDQSQPANSQGSRPCLPATSDEAYHHGTEIWYPNQSMQPGNSQYMQCLGQPKNEDMSCSDQYTFSDDNAARYVWDHRHYFNFFVTGYGKSGCTNTTLDSPPPALKNGTANNLVQRIGNWVSTYGGSG